MDVASVVRTIFGTIAGKERPSRARRTFAIGTGQAISITNVLDRRFDAPRLEMPAQVGIAAKREGRSTALEPELTHFDSSGASRMVDVSTKEVTLREAVASGIVVMEPETLSLILDRGLAKGDVLEVARLAGIMAAKRTSDLIPLCHPLSLSSVALSLEPTSERTLSVRAICRIEGKTGVEMEALTAVSVACLTVYDMCKAIDRGMRITDIQLEQKSGGRSGTFVRGESSATD